MELNARSSPQNCRRMPKKKAKRAGKKGKKKNGGKGKAQAAAEKDELLKKMRNFSKAYRSRSESSEKKVVVSGQLVQDIMLCLEEEKPFVRVSNCCTRKKYFVKAFRLWRW